jgi:hypothetical protein
MSFVPLPHSCASALTMTSITQLLSPWPITKHSVVLREPLLPPSNSATPPRDHLDSMQQSSPASPNDPSSGDMMAVISNSAESDGGEGNGDGRKGYGKRELSTSKRAAQNRAAQVSLSYVSDRRPWLPWTWRFQSGIWVVIWSCGCWIDPQSVCCPPEEDTALLPQHLLHRVDSSYHCVSACTA